MENTPEICCHLRIKEHHGICLRDVPVQMGIPLPKGRFHDSSQISLLNQEGTLWPCEVQPIAHWSDTSIKWCLLKGHATLEPHQEISLSISDKKQVENRITPEIKSIVSEQDGLIGIRTKNYTFSINRKVFSLFDRVEKLTGETAIDHGYCRLTLKDGIALEPSISRLDYQSSIVNSSVQGVTLEISGEFRDKKLGLVVFFESLMEFDVQTDSVRCSFALHNPKPAKHYQGLWDLGDPNSVFFDNLDIGVRLPDGGKVSWITEENLGWQELDGRSLAIYQESSGGDNWDSPNHLNAMNQVPLRLKGYECVIDGQRVLHGRRATPGLNLKFDQCSLNLCLTHFWQNFPKSIRIDNQTLNFGLFPKQFQDGFELQPGEKKTHSFYLNLDQPRDSLVSVHHPPQIIHNPDWIAHCKVFPFFSRTAESPIQSIIAEGLDPDHGFFRKREIIDEYGWRNFGDLYADHETEGTDIEEGQFISHYNNQYDPIYGFIRQFALTGDSRWFELADDLARHVTDIDLYHTDFDKDEYNNGMFWHTDHYQEAKTSSHRSYSKYQKKNAYINHAGGGGPGGQHCYTTGLLYHYYLTGYKASARSVYQLLDWITRVYEGSGTVLDVLLAIRNRSRIGLKNIFTGRYPLDRGTGNYLHALLDVFELCQKRETLRKVEHVIRNTVHPNDNLVDRDLKNVEIRWFYTAFFQALARYLIVKEEIQELDDAFYYARDTLLHYANWMAVHEQPYLETPEILEFPNNTWTAQDLRKVNLLMLADYYAPESHEKYRSRAQAIHEYIIDKLNVDPNRHYTRILAILMQNCGAYEYFMGLAEKPQFDDVKTYADHRKHTKLTAFRKLSAALFEALARSSIKKELFWLARRSGKLARILGYHP
jgi:hypothetical protein